ncbi:hypothetical protein [Halorubrum sp. Atlit-26R]|jgi:hypothetical protein|uniref:hypothetical protein n=1 Tax=Halorubrum sp. Atlit-26R TaxID=2282128 RepID=UPI000EF281D3|nr:hypothetical protein [Halorubrum sp. Atlit-26R]RLM67644.1 hypothetical protein DVK07_12865 [Halorubrum sp. Atlit-26R]
MTDDHVPRRFELVREEDVSETSGTGVVAVGVEYPDGAVHMQWRNADNDGLETDANGCAFKPAPDGLVATEEIHGHDGRTTVRFLDGAPDRD